MTPTSTSTGTQQGLSFDCLLISLVQTNLRGKMNIFLKGRSYAMGWSVVGAFGSVWLWHGVSLVFLDLVTIGVFVGSCIQQEH